MTKQKRSGKVGEGHQVIEKNPIDSSAKEIAWQANEVQVDSETKLESDTGWGAAAVIRRFTFSVNPESFKKQIPSKQELFNHHLKQIEIFLWKDGLKIMTDVAPALAFNKKKTQYTIIVGALPMKGQLLNQTPTTLSQLVNTRQ